MLCNAFFTRGVAFFFDGVEDAAEFGEPLYGGFVSYVDVVLGGELWKGEDLRVDLRR